MAKHKKKKKRDKQETAADDLSSVAAQSVRKFREVTNELAKLSPGQKLAGGLVLVAAGLLYLERRRFGHAVEAVIPSHADWSRLIAPDATPVEAAGPVPPRKSRKSVKTGKSRPASTPPSGSPA